MNSQSPATGASGPSGMLRLVAMFVVLALAALGSLVVIGEIPLETFSEMSIKIALLAGIAGVTSVVIWALMRMGRR